MRNSWHGAGSSEAGLDLAVHHGRHQEIHLVGRRKGEREQVSERSRASLEEEEHTKKYEQLLH